jgi:hypothetical protein
VTHPPLRDTLLRGQELINNRQFEEARAFLEPEVSAYWFSYAEALFQLSLAQRLCGDDEAADRTWNLAKVSPDYSDTLEGDFLRDVALSKIRTLTELASVHPLLDLIQELHKDDLDRLACVSMVRARLVAAQGGNFKQACTVHLDAEEKWRHLENTGKPGNLQWQYLNLVHFAIHARYAGNLVLTTRLLRRILQEFPHQNSGNRKLAIWAVLHGILGGHLARALERLLKVR